jgi:hypothetical protein
MLQGVTIALWGARRLSTVHPAPTVLHRSVPAWLPGPPRMCSASLALVHGQLTLHGVDPLISVFE